MTWFPISFFPIQTANSSGVPYSGAVIKAYDDQTSTPILMATDYTGATTATTFTLNSFGYPSYAGAVIIPHVEINCKIALYPNQAAADANSGAIFTVDNIRLAGGAVNNGARVDIASAATLDLNSTATNYFNVTGTTGVTTITLAEGAQVVVRFAGILTLTHGSFLINLGAANITTAAGDIAVFRGEAAGVVRMLDYSRSVSASGLVLLSTQTVSGSPTAVDFINGTGGVVFDGTYSKYLFTGSNIHGSGATAALNVRTSGNLGVSFDSGASEYTYHFITARTSSATITNTFADGSAVVMTDNNIVPTSNTSSGFTFNLEIANPNQTGNNKAMFFTTSCGNAAAASDMRTTIGSASRNNNTPAVNAIRFLITSGTFTRGTFKLYGYN